MACAGGHGSNYSNGSYLKLKFTLVLDARAARMIKVDNYRLVVTYGLQLAHTGRNALSEINFEKKNVKTSFEYMLLIIYINIYIQPYALKLYRSQSDRRIK